MPLDCSVGNLKKLELRNSQIGDDSLAEIVKLKHLWSLDLRGTRITNDALKRLPADITEAHLKIGSRLLDCETVQAMLTNTKAEYVCVNDCDLSGMDFSFLNQMKELRLLDLANANIGPKELLSIPVDAPMKTLNVRGSRIDDATVEHLAKMKFVTDLYLCNCQVSTAHLSKLAKNRTITTIVCFDCKLDADVHKQVSAASNRRVELVAGEILKLD